MAWTTWPHGTPEAPEVHGVGIAPITSELDETPRFACWWRADRVRNKSRRAGVRASCLVGIHRPHPGRRRRKLNRRRPRYVRGSVGKTVRLGRA